MDSYAVGVDVGGTKIAAGLVGPDGALVARHTLPTPRDRDAGAVLDAIESAARTVAAGHRIAALGVGTGGVVDTATGVIVSATDLLPPDWVGCRVGPRLRERLGVPVAVDNDANALAAGELAGAGPDTVLYAAIGTGIGGALVVDGALRHGRHHTAGGIGHLPVATDSPRRCSCGRPGHLEAVASGPAIADAYRPGTADLRAVVAAADAGDDRAAAVLDSAAAVAGRALAGAANLVDPDRVVVGGGVAQIGPRFLDPLNAAFAAELLPPLGALRVEPARLGADASVLGAAALTTPLIRRNA
ncbi:MAG TPA: ROK family protein [Actinocatenispora sp.]